VVVVATGTVATVAVTAGSAVAITTGTVVAVVVARSTFTTLGFNVSFGLGKECAHRETEFTCLLVDFDKLNFYFVAFVETGCFHIFETFP
jgi:hypothetical protein